MILPKMVLPKRAQSGVSPASSARTRVFLNLRIEIKKRRQAGPELLLDFFLATLKDVHGDTRFPAVFEFYGCIANLGDFIGGQKAQAIHQCQICHFQIVSQNGEGDAKLPRAAEGRKTEVTLRRDAGFSACVRTKIRRTPWNKSWQFPVPQGRPVLTLLPRRPLQRAPTNKVQVEVEDRLPGARAHVQHRAITVLNRALAGDLRRRQVAAANKFG